MPEFLIDTPIYRAYMSYINGKIINLSINTSFYRWIHHKQIIIALYRWVHNTPTKYVLYRWVHHNQTHMSSIDECTIHQTNMSYIDGCTIQRQCMSSADFEMYPEWYNRQEPGQLVVITLVYKTTC
jgi:hypothetical protein